MHETTRRSLKGTALSRKSQILRSTAHVIEIKPVATTEAWGPNDWRQGAFGADGSVLYLDGSIGYICVYICQTSTTHVSYVHMGTSS